MCQLQVLNYHIFSKLSIIKKGGMYKFIVRHRMPFVQSHFLFAAIFYFKVSTIVLLAPRFNGTHATLKSLNEIRGGKCTPHRSSLTSFVRIYKTITLAHSLPTPRFQFFSTKLQKSIDKKK